MAVDPPWWPLVVEIYPRLLTCPVNRSVPACRIAYLDHLDLPANPAGRERAASTEDAFDAAISARFMHEHQAELAPHRPCRPRRLSKAGSGFPGSVALPAAPAGRCSYLTTTVPAMPGWMTQV